MMKFIFFFIFSMILTIKECFLMVPGLVIILGMIFFLLNFNFSDYVEVGHGLSFDLLSYSLIILSFWIVYLMYYSSYGIYKSDSSVIFFSLSCLMLLFVLFLTFSVKNLLSFYFFFEISLIPTMLIILGWGYQPERLQAGVYFLFYTLTASLPLLVSLIYTSETALELSMIFYFSFEMKNYLSWWMFLSLTLAFLVKMPMFFSHLWLPKAHVEAPVAGSMILAGVLLKLGGYGFYRVFWLCKSGLKFFGGYVFGLSLVGMIYVGLMCCRLNDLKALVAYSSVAHMGMVISGVYTLSFWGLTGGLIMMISHGLASSGLFCLVNMYYERSGSRSIYINSGLILFYPLFTLMFFMLSAANMAAPPTINLASEIFLMVSMLKYDLIMLMAFPLGSYLGAVFTLFMFSFSQHGKNFFGNYSFVKSCFREFHLLSMHVVPVNILILKMDWLFCV